MPPADEGEKCCIGVLHSQRVLGRLPFSKRAFHFTKRGKSDCEPWQGNFFSVFEKMHHAHCCVILHDRSLGLVQKCQFFWEQRLFFTLPLTCSSLSCSRYFVKLGRGFFTVTLLQVKVHRVLQPRLSGD